MQWSEEEFLKWVREHPAVQDLIERTKDQPPDSEAGSKRPLWNFLRTAAPRHKLKVLLRLTGLPVARRTSSERRTISRVAVGQGTFSRLCLIAYQLT